MNYNEIIDALKDGKKLTRLNNPLIFINDEKGKILEVEYIFANSQFNRMFAKLKNGKVEDYNFDILDVYWNCEDIVEYEELEEVDFITAFKAYKNYKEVKSFVSERYYKKNNHNRWNMEYHTEEKEIDGKWGIVKEGE